tara:strand:+ start:48 stop:443 length:396 start_codon:yes stop_codon:yes gene_type:complete
MKKKTNIRTIIRKIVREEVAMAIQEVITELKQPPQPKQKSKKIVEKKSFTNNSVLNDVLNETAQREEWKTMGGGKFDSSRMNELISGQYGDMMSNQSPNISVDGQTPDFLKKDYSAVVKKGLEIDKQKHRG